MSTMSTRGSFHMEEGSGRRNREVAARKVRRT